MTDREEEMPGGSCGTPSTNSLDWEQERSKIRVRQFMNILEQLPRLCSPTICGTLSQPTTKSERLSCGAELFEWSLEQKAILSPANITTDADGNDDWHNVASELNPSWRQQESDMFFSQRTIAPSPLATPSRRIHLIKELVLDEEDENEEAIDSEEEEDAIEEAESDGEIKIEEDHDDGQDVDNLLFSPTPLKSSQTQQKMDVFSPDTFTRIMEDENTLQSTPKTTGSLINPNRMRSYFLD